MLPLEIVFFLLVTIWTMIGSVRGFSKEVGATIALVLAMCVLLFFGPQMINFFNKIFGSLFGIKIPVATSLAPGVSPFCAVPSAEQFWFYMAIFVVIVYLGYQGDTLGLPTQLGSAPSAIMGVLIGAVNGWFIAGNLWWFLDHCANYSLPKIGINGVGVLSSTAQTLVKLLPFEILSPVLLIGLLFLLLVLRIAK